MIEAFTGSPRYFVERPPVGSTDELDRRLRSGELQITLEIPPDFGRDLRSRRSPEVAVSLDGRMPFRGETTKGYVTALAARLSRT